MEDKKMEPFDFLQCTSSDVSLYIMSYIDDPADLIRASAVSRFWLDFVIENGLAKKLCLKCFPQLSNVAGVLKAREESTKSNEKVVNKSMKLEILERDHMAYASLLHALTKSNISPKDCISNAISASSTDNYPDESVVNTLNPRDRFIRRASYWSSKGQSNPAVPETLIYKLRSGIWVITEIDVQPFEAFFQNGRPIYSAKCVRFRVGHPNSSVDVEDNIQYLTSEKSADDKFVWTYTSPEFPMLQENRLQPFRLPEPVLCIGGYIQIELLGRIQRQDMDGLFYICICYVRVLGRPLYPAFDIECREFDGRLFLKYHPENLSSVLQNSSRNEIPHMRQLDEDMLLERIDLLENLVRGIQGGANNPFLWDDDEDEMNVRLL